MTLNLIIVVVESVCYAQALFSDEQRPMSYCEFHGLSPKRRIGGMSVTVLRRFTMYHRVESGYEALARPRCARSRETLRCPVVNSGNSVSRHHFLDVRCGDRTGVASDQVPGGIDEYRGR